MYTRQLRVPVVSEVLGQGYRESPGGLKKFYRVSAFTTKTRSFQLNYKDLIFDVAQKNIQVCSVKQ